MKKLLITGFYFTVTAAVCALGFWFPSALCKYQDAKIYAKIERPEAEPITLTYSSSLYDTLQLLSGDYYLVEYPSASSLHTEKEIHKIVSGLLKKFEKYSILPPNLLSGLPDNIQGQSVTLSLAIASGNKTNRQAGRSQSVSGTLTEPGRTFDTRGGLKTGKAAQTGSPQGASAMQDTSSQQDFPAGPETEKGPGLNTSDYSTAVIWDCSIYFKDSSLMILSIDDNSGKLVGFNIYNSQDNLDTKMELYRMEHIQPSEYAKKVAKFLKKHYKMKTNAALKETREIPFPNIYDKNISITEYVHSIGLTDASGDTLELPLIDSYHEINFN